MLTAVSSALETDPGLDLVAFAQQARNLSAGNVTFATITVDGTQVSIVSVDRAAMPAFIDNVIGQPSAYTTATPAAPGTVHVQVLNGSGINGAAAADTATLARFGFHPGPPGSVEATSTTTIKYPPGMAAQAKAVAAHVPGAVPAESTSVGEVTVVLGIDGHHAIAVAGTPTTSTNPTASTRPTPPPPRPAAPHRRGRSASPPASTDPRARFGRCADGASARVAAISGRCG